MKFASPLRLIDDFDDTHLHHASAWTWPLELVSHRKTEEGTTYWREDRNSVCVTVDILWIY